MLDPAVEQAFLEVVDIPPDERPPFLKGLSAEQTLQLDALLAAEAASRGFFEAAVTRAAQQLREQAAVSAGDRIGAYRITGEIGRGGMGIVYRAERADGQFDQRVAVKVIEQSAGPLPSFDRERRILAQLSHPNIARLLDGGSTPQGLPYFVMELVEGARAIDRYCSEERLDPKRIVQLFLPVCHAIEHVHRSLVVHGDLKPGNILVDNSGVPKLVDFGVARLLQGPQMAAEPTRTIALTLSYASPEQVMGEPLTTATDVYSLAGVLYFVLTGSTPLNLQARPLASAVEAIRNESPRTAKELNSAIPDDLSAILNHALKKRPSERYHSMRALCADLEAFLDGRPVEARGPGKLYRIGKLARRHWLPLTAAAAIILITAGAFASVTNAARRAETARVLAEKRRIDADTARTDALAQRNQAHLAREQSESMRKIAETRSEEADRERRLAEARLDSERRFYELLTHLLDDRFLVGNKDSIRLLDSWLEAQQARVKSDPQDADAQRLVGFLHFRRCVAYVQSSAKRAETDCATAVMELEPFLSTDFPDDLVLRSLTSAYSVLGQIYAGSGRFTDAIAITKKAVALAGKHSPRDSMRFRAELATRSALANVYLLAGRYDEAVATQEEAYAIWTQRNGKANLSGEQALVLPETMRRYARMLARKDPHKAAAQMQRALGMLKEIADDRGAGCVEFNEYADALNSSPIESLRDPPVAQAYAEKAVSVCPPERKPLAMDTLAWAYFRKGDALKAVDLQKQAIQLLPAGPSVERMTLQMSLSQFEKGTK